jgi:hypothetical protein
VDGTGGFTNTSEITINADLSGLSGTVTFTVTAGTATLTPGATTNERKLTFANMTSDSVTITASIVDGGTTFSDVLSLYKVYAGSTTPLMYLADENRTLPADSSGTVASFAGVTTTAAVYLGLVDDTVNWTFASTASGCTIVPSGPGNQTITVTAMSADTATVTIVGSKSGYSNLTRIYKLSKAKQGPQGTAGTNGTNGAAGTRGSIITSAIASSWTDGAAAAAIAVAGGGSPIRTDSVTLYNGSTFSETKTFDGSSWTTVVAQFNGSILVNGTVIASKIAAGAIDASKIAADTITSAQIAAGAITASEIAAGAITADKITASAATIAGTGTFGFGAGTNVAGYGAVGAFEVTSANKFGVIAASATSEPGLVMANRGTGPAGAYFKMRTNSYSGGSTNLITSGIIGGPTVAGTFGAYNTNGTENSSAQMATVGGPAVAAIQRNTSGTTVAQIQLATGSGFAAYTFQGAFGPFTGAHDALVDKNMAFDLGDIVVDYELINKLNVNDVITKVQLSSAPKQKSVLGVISANTGNTVEENSIPTAIAEYSEESNSYVISSVHQAVYDSHDVLAINSLGEGCINVCGENGNIEMGDYITTSSMPGKGMKQDDDLLHNYTVAKARENVTFSSPTEVKQIACSYHCG